MSHGVLLLKAGIYGNVIRFLAPLTTPLDLLAEGLDALEHAFAEV
jgi:4-aminobutyrate aminotransferase/(S)-3-amino-2-methylpropionate transaminase